MQQYYERQFKNKEQSIKIPDKPNMGEYIERLETIVKRWGVRRSFFKCHECPLIVAGSWKRLEALPSHKVFRLHSSFVVVQAPQGSFKTDLNNIVHDHILWPL